jgi:TIR domain
MQDQSDVQIFISYTRADQERVLPVYEFLVRNGYPNTWIDCKKLLPGQPWDFEIKRNLKKSEIVLIFLSNNSISKRGYVQREVNIAIEYLKEKLQDDIYIIPIKLDKEAEIPEVLSGIQCLELQRNDYLDLLKQSLDLQREKLGFENDNSEFKLDEIHSIKKISREKCDGLPGYEVEYSWPELHSTKFANISEISKLIEASLLDHLHLYRLNKLEQQPDLFSWSQNEFQRTNTFDAHYNGVFHKNNFLSISYSVSWYGSWCCTP